MTKRQPNNAVIQMRARRFDLELIDRAAEIEGITRSAFIRDSAAAYARIVLAKRRPIVVSRKRVPTNDPAHLHPLE